MSKCFQSLSKISLKGSISPKSTDVTVLRTLFIDVGEEKGPVQLKNQSQGTVGESGIGIWFLDAGCWLLRNLSLFFSCDRHEHYVCFIQKEIEFKMHEIYVRLFGAKLMCFLLVFVKYFFG